MGVGKAPGQFIVGEGAGTAKGTKGCGAHDRLWVFG
jgi:hypothetical protein